MSDQFQNIFEDTIFQEDSFQEQTIRLKDGERRNVSILFADIHGFTEMSEKLDHEIVQTLIDKLMKVFSDSVEKYGGYVDKYSGDEIMALFGAKVASEVDTTRSVYCALEMQSRISQFNEFLKTQSRFSKLDINLQMRVGVNTGMVTTGKVGKGREKDFTVYGDSVNLASRMETNAPIGSVMLNNRTKQLIDNQFIFEDHGSLELKGITEPQSVYLVKSVNKSFDNDVKDQKYKYIGNQNNLDEINTIYRLAKDQVGGKEYRPFYLTINGDAGMGKTRFISEFLNQQFKNIKIDQYCIKGESTNITVSPYYLFTTVIRNIINISTSDNLKDINNLIDSFYKDLVNYLPDELVSDVTKTKPMIAFLFGISSADPRVNTKGKELQTNIQLALRIFLEAVSHRSNSSGLPLLIILQDIQWIDQLSKDALIYILSSFNLIQRRQNINASIIVFILLQRSGNILSNSNIKLVQNHSLTIETFSENECREFINNQLDGKNLPEDILVELLERSNGNPLFLSEWLTHIDDLSDSKPTIPENLNSLILSKIDTLSDQTKNTLQVASVVGREFYKKIIKTIQSKIEQLESATQENLLILLKNGYILKNLNIQDQYQFKNLLTRDVTYNSILLTNRELLHLHVGETMEDIFCDNLDHYYYQLAEHYDLGQKSDKAIEYLTLAGRTAQDIHDNHKAIEFFDRLLEWIDDSDLQKTIEIILLKCQVLELIGKWSEAKNILEKKLSDIDSEKYSILVGNISSQLGYIYYNQGDYENAERLIQRQLEICKTNDNSIGEAVAWGQIGHVLIDSGKLDEAKQYFQKQLQFYKKEKSELDLALAHRNLGQVELRMGNLEESYKESELAYKKASDMSALHLQSLALGNMGIVFENKGDFNQALNIYNKVLEINEDIGDQKAISHSLTNIGNSYRELRNYELSIKFYNKQIELCNRIGFNPGLAMALNNLGISYSDTGRFDDAIQMYKDALEINQKIGNKSEIGNVNGNLGNLYTELGKFDKALSHLEIVYKIFNDIGNKYVCSIVDCDIANVYLLMGDFIKAEKRILSALIFFNDHDIISQIAKYSITIAKIYIGLEEFEKGLKNIKIAGEKSAIMKDATLILESTLFKSILNYKIDKDIEAFQNNISSLLEEKLTTDFKAQLYYEKWKIDHKDSSRKQAIKFNASLNKKINKFIYKNRLDILQ